MFRAAAWTLGTTAAVVVFDTVQRDDFGIYTSGGNFVAPIAGWYSVFLSIAATTTPPFSILGNVQRNGGRVGYPTSNGVASSPPEAWCSINFNESFSLAAGDTINLTMSGSTAGTGGGTGNDLCVMGMSYLGSG
jgi:hypothetical protein